MKKFTCFLVAVVAVVTIAGLQLVDGACLCNVSENGEYCGTELNRINGNNDCSRDQYLCANSNRGGEAIVVKACRPGYECDVSRNGAANACLIDIDCHCGSTLKLNGRTRYCGGHLTGRDCSSSIVFTCGRSYPHPIDACPNGCRNGRCV